MFNQEWFSLIEGQFSADQVWSDKPRTLYPPVLVRNAAVIWARCVLTFLRHPRETFAEINEFDLLRSPTVVVPSKQTAGFELEGTRITGGRYRRDETRTRSDPTVSFLMKIEKPIHYATGGA